MIALLTLLAPVLAQSEDPARLHPENTVLYLTCPDVPKLLEAYHRAPLLQLIGDPEVRESTAQFIEGLEFDIQGAASQMLQRFGMPADSQDGPLEPVLRFLRATTTLSLSISMEAMDEGSFVRVEEALDELVHIRGILEDLAAGSQGRLPVSLDELGFDEHLSSDPWGRPYVYRRAALGQVGHELFSLGADGAPGGVGLGLDLTATTRIDSVLEGELMKALGFSSVIEFLNESAAAETYRYLCAVAEDAGAPIEDAGDLPGLPGAQIRRISAGPMVSLPAWLMLDGKRITIGLGSSTPEGLVNRITGRAATFEAAPGRASMQRVELGGAGATVLEGMVDPTRFERFFSVMGLPGDIPGLGSIDGIVAWSMRLDGVRFLTDVVLSGSSDSGPGLFGQAPVPSELWRFLPEDAIAVIATSIDGRAIYRELLSASGNVNEQGEPTPPPELTAIESEFGFDLEQDVFGSLGTGATWYLLPITGVITVPGMAVVVQLEDAASFERGLRGLLQFLEQQSGGEFSVRDRPYHDVPLWTFSFESNIPIPISPSLSIVDGHLLITISSLRAKKEIRRIHDGGPGRHPMLTMGARPLEGSTTAWFVDWPALIEGIYTGARGAVSMLGAGGQLPFDVTALPEADLFLRFFEPTLGWSRPIEGARQMHLESSFGPETWVSLAGLALGGWYGFQSYQAYQPDPTLVETLPTPESSEPDSGAATREALGFLSTRLAVYQLEQGRYPARLSDLVGATENYPNGFLDGKALPSDGWGRSFAYSAPPDGSSYRLWSLGSDGVDEQGGGDDLSGN